MPDTWEEKVAEGFISISSRKHQAQSLTYIPSLNEANNEELLNICNDPFLECLCTCGDTNITSFSHCYDYPTTNENIDRYPHMDSNAIAGPAVCHPHGNPQT